MPCANVHQSQRRGRGPRSSSPFVLESMRTQQQRQQQRYQRARRQQRLPPPQTRPKHPSSPSILHSRQVISASPPVLTHWAWTGCVHAPGEALQRAGRPPQTARWLQWLAQVRCGTLRASRRADSYQRDVGTDDAGRNNTPLLPLNLYVADRRIKGVSTMWGCEVPSKVRICTDCCDPEVLSHFLALHACVQGQITL